MQTHDAEQRSALLEGVVGEPVPTAQRQTVQGYVSQLPLRTGAEHSPATVMLKVSTRSRPSAVAGAIAGVLRGHTNVEMQSIGAGATNQAIKAIAIARAYLVDDGMDVGIVPSFIDILIDGEERTAMRLLVERRSQ